MRPHALSVLALASVLVLGPAPSAGAAWAGAAPGEAALMAAGVSQNTIRALGSNEAVVADLLQSGELPAANARHLAASLLSTPVQPLRHDGGLPAAAPGLGTSGGPVAAASPMQEDCVAGTGAYYDVWTKVGYNQESGTVTLGDATNANTGNDAFYASLGAGTRFGNADMGIWTSGGGSTATWYVYESGTYEAYWTSVSFSQATHPTVYLDLQVGNDTLTLQVIDPTSGTVVGRYQANVSAAYHFNARGKGVALYRFDSIAQNAENLTDGSTLLGQAWQNVREYSGGQSQLVTAYGAEAGPQCSAAEVATVSYTQTPWYDSDVSIQY